MEGDCGGGVVLPHARRQLHCCHCPPGAFSPLRVFLPPPPPLTWTPPHPSPSGTPSPLLGHPLRFWGTSCPSHQAYHSPLPPFLPPPRFLPPPHNRRGADERLQIPEQGFIGPQQMGGEHGPGGGGDTDTPPPPNPSTDPTLGFDTKTHRETWNNLTPGAVLMGGGSPQSPP